MSQNSQNYFNPTLKDETSIIPLEILQLRAKLRERSDNILIGEQQKLIEEEERNIQSKISVQYPSWENSEVEAACDILKIIEHGLLVEPHKDLMASDLYPEVHQHEFDYHRTESINIPLEKRCEKILASDKKKLDVSIRRAHLLCDEYLSKKRDLATDELSLALQNMIDEVERDGEELWRKEVSKTVDDWKLGGSLRKAYEDSQKATWELQEKLVNQFVNEQKQMAAELAAKELRREIRRIVTSNVLKTDQICSHVNDVAAAHLANIDLFTNLLDNKGGPDELDMTTTMTNHAASARHKIDTSLTALSDINKRNMKTAAQVAVLKEIDSRQAGDDIDIICSALLELV